MKQKLFIQWSLTGCVVLLLAAGIFLGRRNRYLSDVNSRLMLQNDSVLSVNLKLQKELTRMQHGIDSMEQVPQNGERITRANKINSLTSR